MSVSEHDHWAGEAPAEREHGTRARHCFGPSGGDPANGCRCAACTQANRVYARFDAKRRRLARSQGTWATPYVDTGAARAHIDQLRAAGIGARQVAALAGIGRSRITNITAGRIARIRRATEAAILAVEAKPAAGSLVDAGPTWELVERLVAHGTTRKQIGQAASGNPDALRLQLGRERITAGAAERIEALHWEILGDPANPDRPDTRRFDAEVLFTFGAGRQMTRSAVARLAGLHLARATQTGLSDAQAERAAMAFGLHPANLWLEWYDTDDATTGPTCTGPHDHMPTCGPGPVAS